MLNSKATELIAQDAKVSKNDAILVLGALADLLKETVHDKGEVVIVKGLGVFSRQLVTVDDKKKITIKFNHSFTEINEEETSV